MFTINSFFLVRIGFTWGFRRAYVPFTRFRASGTFPGGLIGWLSIQRRLLIGWISPGGLQLQLLDLIVVDGWEAIPRSVLLFFLLFLLNEPNRNSILNFPSLKHLYGGSRIQRIHSILQDPDPNFFFLRRGAKSKPCWGVRHKKWSEPSLYVAICRHWQ